MKIPNFYELLKIFVFSWFFYKKRHVLLAKTPHSGAGQSRCHKWPRFFSASWRPSFVLPVLAPEGWEECILFGPFIFEQFLTMITYNYTYRYTRTHTYTHKHIYAHAHNIFIISVFSSHYWVKTNIFTL